MSIKFMEVFYMKSHNKVLAVVFSENDLLEKINDLKASGYKERNLHVMAKDTKHFENISVEGTDVDTFTDKFKGFITGDSGIRAGVKSLKLSEEETSRYTSDLAKGGILIYEDEDHKTILDEISSTEDGIESKDPNEQQRHQFINSVDNNFDEQEDRFARGETFMQDATLIKDEHHNSFTTEEKSEIQKTRGGSSEAEKHSQNDKKYK